MSCERCAAVDAKKAARPEKEKNDKLKFFFNLSRILTAAVLTGLFYADFGNTWINRSLVIAAYVLIGYDTAWRMVKSFAHKEFFDENFLMMIATVGAFFVDEFPEASLVLILYHIGEMLEDYATEKANRSIVSLVSNMPLYAHKVEGTKLVDSAPEDIKIGDILEIKPGEKVALDGVLETEGAAVDQSSLTGESLPVNLSRGSVVYSGSINLDTTFRLRVTKIFSDSTLSTIMNLISSEESRKSQQERFITRFSKVYTPIVCLISAFIFVLLFGLNGFADYQKPLYNALNILIISCPCSLVISIPLTFFMGIGKASRFGVLIKGGMALENAGRTNIYCFDKTGTITKGSFSLLNAEELSTVALEVAGSLEKGISHPIAKAYVEAQEARGLPDLKVADFKNIPGLGIEGRIKETLYRLGSKKFMCTLGFKPEEIETPYLVNYLADEEKIVARYILADEVKPSSAAAIAALRSDKVKEAVMLSGDGSDICARVGAKVGATAVESSLMPADKVEAIAKYKGQKGNLVAFVGDGINDSPSLIAADLGIAMGGLGSEAAIESADIVIMNDDLEKVVTTRRLSKLVMKLILENIVFILLVKLTIIVLASFSLSNMILSITADVGVMILAILNSTRVLLFGRQKNKAVCQGAQKTVES